MPTPPTPVEAATDVAAPASDVVDAMRSADAGARFRVLVAAGGTAGHLAPALTVAAELRHRGAHVEVATATGRDHEATIVAAGFAVHVFPIGGLPRRPGLGQLVAVWRALVAVARCRRIIRQVRPDALLAGGGFVSAPAAVAAWLSRVPVVATEADAHLGLANRIAGRVAVRLCTAYPLPQLRLRQQVTGRPVSAAFVDVDRVAARAALADPARAETTGIGAPVALGADDVALLVIGGSGGATHLSQCTFDAWGADADPQVAGRRLTVFAVTGRRDAGTWAAPASDRVRLVDYCTDVPTLLGAVDLVVARPGGTVFELAAAGRASVLVPSPNVTNDHQRPNAEHFVRAGGAELAEDRQLDGLALRAIAERLLAPGADAGRASMAAAMRAAARPGAAADIATVVAQVAAAHARRGGRSDGADARTPAGVAA